MTENLIGGGILCRIHGASGLGVDNVPNAKRGLVVQSAAVYADGHGHAAGRYQLTQRAFRGSSLWRVNRIDPISFRAIDLRSPGH